MLAMPPLDVAYNVPEDPEAGRVYFQSVNTLPTRKEHFAERTGLAARLAESVTTANLPVAFRSDRTVEVAVATPTPTFLRALQSEILAAFPLWRIAVVGPGAAIVVYSHGVRHGDVCIEGAVEDDHPLLDRMSIPTGAGLPERE